MSHVLVLFGGNSPERPISIRSADAVCDALRASGHTITTFDTANHTDQLIPLLSTTDVVFPVLHGEGGEDGSIQLILETHGAKYIGSDSIASALCFDKWQYKQLLSQHDLPQAEGALVSKNEFMEHPLTKRPFVLKPNDGGSSIETHIVRDVSAQAVSDCLTAFNNHEFMLLEELIVGVEITVGVLGDSALPVIEIIPPQNKEFDLENKYNGASQELCPPKHVSSTAQRAAQDLAVRIHSIAGCRHMSRTDIMLDASENPYILETNTIPGMTPQSLFPKSAATSGMPMPKLVDNLVRMALTE